jgi:hypothetical protein
MVATDPPRNVIYYSSNANQIPLAAHESPHFFLLYLARIRCDFLQHVECWRMRVSWVRWSDGLVGV